MTNTKNPGNTAKEISPELLTLKNVMATVNFKKTHIYGMIKKGEFPKPLRVGKRAVRWSRLAIQDWVFRQQFAEATSANFK